jgi:SAM-dependent methyltransferase
MSLWERTLRSIRRPDDPSTHDGTPELAPGEDMAFADDWYDGTCSLCGVTGRFLRLRQFTRETFRCPACRGFHRYQGQARVIVDHYARHGSTCLADLAQEPEFQALRIWEPCERSPLKRHLYPLPNYESTSYWPDVEPGEHRDGVRCEDLMALSFPDEALDLVLTSDVFEHVRRPYAGFAEVHRVLRPGGAHIFSIPVSWPMPDRTVPRVDVTTEEDVHLLKPVYHVTHLVYNDFGADLLVELQRIGFDTTAVRFEASNELARRLITFKSIKVGSPDVV